ncbi:MAG: leucine-rich repeat protein, partial [Intestinibacter sp.]|uniref:leucine-rich repeat protein n=1 Tax=Intestinibacter sp. TaxID=1965304 RepID=UPI002A7EF879
YFDVNGLAEELTVIEDVPTTCTERGYKIVQNSLGVKQTVKYSTPIGHDYVHMDDYDETGMCKCRGCGIEAKDIATLNVSLYGYRFAYTGGSLSPRATVEGLKEGVDYRVWYSNNVNPGDAIVTVRGIGNYIGTVTKTFVIYRKMSTLEANLEYTKCIYDGKEKTPKVTIEGLTEGKDYTVSYSNNVNAGEGKVIITGIGTYNSGTLTTTFKIAPTDISGKEPVLSYTECEYNGKERKPDVKIDGLEKGIDYEVSYENNIEVGTAKVIVKGIGNYQGTIEKTFTIKEENKDRIDISELEIKLESDSYIYTGEVIKPAVTIEGLEENVDYVVTYENNIEIGTAKVTIEGIGNYRGAVEKEFTIKDSRIDISTLNVSLYGYRYAYTGKAFSPRVTIQGLKEGVDYRVWYSNNVNVGNAVVTIKGIGNYIGTVTKTFVIYRKMSTLEANLEYTKCIYDGKEKTPKVTIEGLTEGKDYTVSYSNNVNIGMATVTIKGIDPYYTGTITKTFTITEQNINALSLKLEADNLDTANKQTLEIEALEEGEDYIVTYDLGEDSNTINIEGIGNYEGQKTLKASKDTEMIVVEDGVQYNLLSNGDAEVYNFTELGKEAKIKSKVKNHKVTKISKKAFKKCEKLELVKIPNSVLEIEKDAFKDCKNITISGNLDSYAKTYADKNKINFKESK